jgi:hypothetical protein
MTQTSISLLCFLSISRALVAQPCAPPPKDLSAWFSFDEPVFSRAARVPGFVGNALHFDGKSTFFEIPAATPGLDGGEDNFSVEVWVRAPKRGNLSNIVDKRSPIPRGWLIYIRKGAPGFQVVNGAELTDSVADKFPIDDGRWHHIVGVARRLPQQAPQVFVDGQLRSQNGRNITLANITNEAPVWLARHHANNYIRRDDIYFEGDVDELSFYRRALAPSEVAALFRAGRAGKCRK